MKYQEVLPISRAEAEQALNSNNSEVVCDALLRLTYHDSDWRWIQNICLNFVKSKDTQIRRLAVICLGHLARIHGTLDVEQVIPVLENLLHDSNVAGNVKDALDDIQMFATNQQR